MIGSGWGGIIALKIALFFEAEGRSISIILLDAEPLSVQKWASVLKDDLEIELLNRYFNIDEKVC